MFGQFFDCEYYVGQWGIECGGDVGCVVGQQEVGGLVWIVEVQCVFDYVYEVGIDVDGWFFVFY